MKTSVLHCYKMFNDYWLLLPPVTGTTQVEFGGTRLSGIKKVYEAKREQ